MSDGDHAIPITTGNTRITFAVRWLGLLTVRGRFTAIEGTLRIPEGCVEAADVVVEVAAASLSTGIGLRDRHLRGARFLDAGRHPRIVFRSVRVERPNGLLVVTGVLSLHGSEHEVTAACPLDFAEGSGMRSMVRMRAELRVPRLAYGVGVATGLRRFNPLLRAIGRQVTIRAEVLVPATQLLPALLPALGR